ncbi:hypothetical protein TAMA11512_02450 [Selenomonas sp. TAMA-11512]|uniref:formate dehydrogenase accessory protein FdhE n=1 Tax=Selenomonas sp. TAMA-11512 TaxID=3095337 RepID=UPI00308EEE4F|nr:hypothetical protein TAMA11512_02450 [Selenomonas sp. TAMA-11512]
MKRRIVDPQVKLNEYLEQHPFLAETAALHQSMQEVAAKTVKPVDLPENKEDTKLGIPLLQQTAAKTALLEAAPTAYLHLLTGLSKVESFPKRLQETLRGFRAYMQKARVDRRRRILRMLLEQLDEDIRLWALQEGQEETILRMTGWLLIDHLVPDVYRDAERYEEEGVWQKPYCPVCGRLPVLSQLAKQAEGRKRYLVCDGCRTKWVYKRVGCVYCGNDDLQKMHILDTEKEPMVRLDVCDACKSYLKTINREDDPFIYLQDWTTLHMDLLAENEGFTKRGSIMAGNPANE